MDPTSPQASNLSIPTTALLGLLVSAVPMIWYPNYLLILGLYALFSPGTGVLGVLFGVISLGYPALLIGAIVVAHIVGRKTAISTAVALTPILILIGSGLADGLSLSTFFGH